jgi:predicted PurR-regulated permease PerM
MENQDKNHTDEPIPKNHFTPNSRYFTILVYALAFVLGAILIYIFIGHFNVTLRLIGQIAHLLSPFITGAFIAFVLYPLVHLLYRDVFTKRFKMAVRPAKMLSILVSYLLAIGIITVLLVFIIPQIYESLSDLTQLLPVWYNNAVAFLEQFEETHTALSFIDYNILNEKIYSALPKIVDYLTGIMTNILPVIVSASMAIVKGVLNFIIAIIVSVYMISDHKIIFYHFKRLMYTIMPKQTADTTRSILRESGNIFSSFIIGKAIDSLIIGIICFVCTTILRFPYAVLLSVIVGITNIIPYFGPYMGGVIGGVVILIVSPVKVIFWAILILIIQQFDGLYLGPKILGEKTGLRPLWVIFSITVGGSLFGVVGMFLGVPCVAVLSYILNLAIEHFLKKKNIYITPYDNTDEM